MDAGGFGGGLRRLLSGSVVMFVIVLVALFSSAGTIGTGNVGVRTTLGLISAGEVSPGIYVKWPFISTVQEFSAKEINIDLADLTPKAKDNLSLRDMDLTIYYRAQNSRIAALQAKYAGQSVRSEMGYWLPAYDLVMRVARNIVYEEVARVDSLVMHTKRDELAAAIKRNMQAELDKSDPGTFYVTRVVVRSVITDPSIERSIQEAVANQKKLEAMAVQTEIAKKEAEVKITEARGIAEANRIINQSLTREYLQHEANQALVEFARKGNSNTVILPAGSSIAPLINVPSGGNPARSQP